MHFWEILTLLLVGVPLAGVSSIVPALIWTTHRRKMTELRMQNNRAVAEDVRGEFAALRNELRELRDTTMQYDLSFDTALQQLERRIGQIERSKHVQAEPSSPVERKYSQSESSSQQAASQQSMSQQNVSLGNRL